MYFQRILFIFEFILKPSPSAIFFSVFTISVSIANVIFNFLLFFAEGVLLLYRLVSNDSLSSHMYRSCLNFIECKCMRQKPNPREDSGILFHFEGFGSIL